ncbi:MAG TPA: hypothetical protein ENJ60_00500 [Aeromonadales bacterium]|nr:hypothetical protein [Aeromonadales bacterium]
MIKFILYLVLSTISINVFSQPYTELIYSELKFNLPGNFTLVGDLGGKDNILIFRYGDKKGKNYIAFTDMTNDKSIDYRCSPSIFYMDLFSKNNNTRCNKEKINILNTVFIDNNEIITWKTEKYTLNYSSDHNKAFVFISGKDGKLIKIDSDFISRKEFKSMFEHILQIKY